MTETIGVMAAAVITASLLGSMHCVGMCGPLAIWAGGGGEQVTRRTAITSTTLYHLGRLTTYTLAGLLAGLIGSVIDIGGGLLGIQVAAARLVGGVMIALGVYKLWTMFVAKRKPSSEGIPQVTGPSGVSKLLVRLRPYVFGLPIPARGFATGLLTTLLPCGWLYLFALIAAGTGHPISGGIVMAAFWVGTVPALVTLVAGVRLLSQRYTRTIPALAAAALIGAGFFTASGRGFAGLNSLDSLQIEGDTLQQVEQVDEQVPPCCRVPQDTEEPQQ
jgi:sulfite exporter TauE/SafE